MIFPIGQDILIREGSSLTILGMNLFVILRQGKDFTFTLRIGINQSEHHYTTARWAGARIGLSQSVCGYILPNI